LFLDAFHEKQDRSISITAEQGSRFAKSVAGDFNPIHDPGHRRFCVPGDLLFALAVQHFGLSTSIEVQFKSLVDADQRLLMPTFNPDEASQTHDIIDERDRVIMQWTQSGMRTADSAQLEQLIRAYVAFSGQNFPHVLVPLLEQHQIMFHPKRPFVIYDSMSLQLDRLDFTNPHLELTERSLIESDRRADVTFSFVWKDADQIIGTGSKTLIISGLQPYDAEAMAEVVADFLTARECYHAA